MRSLFPWRRKAAARQRSVRKPSFQPTVECLESRDTPSVTINATGTVLTVRGDNGGIVHNDTFYLRFHPGTTTLQLRQIVSGTVVASGDIPASFTQININGLGGTDTILVKALPANVTLTATQPEVFTAGNNHSLADIRGNIVLTTNDDGPATAATFDDSLGTTRRVVTLTRDGLSGLLPEGAIDFSHARLGSLTVDTGSGFGGDSITVLSTRGKTTLNTGDGGDLVIVGQTFDINTGLAGTILAG